METNVSAPRDLLPVPAFSQKFPAWSPPALRAIIFEARTNGLEEAQVIFRLGRRILLSESRFFVWIAKQQKNRSKAAK